MICYRGDGTVPTPPGSTEPSTINGLTLLVGKHSRRSINPKWSSTEVHLSFPIHGRFEPFHPSRNWCHRQAAAIINTGPTLLITYTRWQDAPEVKLTNQNEVDYGEEIGHLQPAVISHEGVDIGASPDVSILCSATADATINIDVRH